MILGICSVLLRALPKISPKPLLRGWGARRSGLEGPWEGAGEDMGRAGGSASPGAYAVCLMYAQARPGCTARADVPEGV